jgi:hypothetical protein
MGKYTGRDIKIGIGKETSRGTPHAASYWIPRRDFDVEDKVLTVIDDQGYGVIEDSTDIKVVSKYAEGNIAGLVRANDVGLLVHAALGSPVAVTGSAASAYTHTYYVLQTHQHPSLTIEVDDPVEDDVQFPLAMINSLEIVADVNEFVLFNVGFMSLPSTATPVTAAYTASPRTFTAKDVHVTIADTTTGLPLTTSSPIEVKGVTFTIEKEVEKDDILGSVSPTDFLNKTVRVSVVVRKNYTDVNFKDRFTAASPMAMRILIEDTDVAISSSPAAYPKIRIDLNQVKITDWTVSRDLDGVLAEEFTAKANFKMG